MKDRTNQFLKILQNLDPNIKNSQAPIAIPKAKFVTENQFLDKFKQIQTNINQIKAKLSDLESISEESSIFNQSEQKISNLSFKIKKGLEEINGEIKDAESLISAPSSQPVLHSRNIVSKLKMELSDIAKNFQNVLAIRTKKLQDETLRRKKYSSQTFIRSRDFSKLRSRNKVALDEEEETSMEARGKGIKMETMMKQRETKGVEQDRYLTERLEATQEVENTLTELSSMFQRLSAIVAVQDEVCQRIDANVDETEGNVEMGNTQLQKYHLSVSGNRLLILKVFTMIIFVAIVFFLFLN